MGLSRGSPDTSPARAERVNSPIAKRMKSTPFDDVRDAERRDEAAAADAREHLRALGVEVIPADARVKPLLAPGEVVHAFRCSTLLDRCQVAAPLDSALQGDLYVTSARIIHLGRELVAYRTEDIREVALSGDRLLLLMNDGLSVALVVDRPRLLCVEIAAARAGRRSGARASAGQPRL